MIYTRIFLCIQFCLMHMLDQCRVLCHFPGLCSTTRSAARSIVHFVTVAASTAPTNFSIRWMFIDFSSFVCLTPCIAQSTHVFVHHGTPSNCWQRLKCSWVAGNREETIRFTVIVILDRKSISNMLFKKKVYNKTGIEAQWQKKYDRMKDTHLQIHTISVRFSIDNDNCQRKIVRNHTCKQFEVRACSHNHCEQ